MNFFLSALLFLLPFQWAVVLPGLPEVPWFRLAAAFLIALWAATLVLRPQQACLPPILIFPCASFLGAVLLSVFLVPEWGGEWLRKYLFLIGMLPLTLVWYAAFFQISSRQLLKALVLGATTSAFVGLVIFSLQWLWDVWTMLQVLTHTILPFFLGERLGTLVALYPSLLVNIGGATWLRVTALFPDPHVAAFFFGMTACLALGLYQETKRRLWLAATGILIVADFLTFSRGGYFGLISGLCLYAVFFFKSRQMSRVAFWMFAGLPLILFFGWPVLARFASSFTLVDDSSTERFRLWSEAFSTWASAPVFGVGLGQYAERMFPWTGDSLPYYAHNLYLDIGVELGTLGLIFWLAYLLVPVLTAWTKAWRSGGVSLGAVAAVLVYAAHSLFETALFSLHVAVLLSFVLALLAWEARPARDRVQ